jgi:hypothetical protein
MAFPLLRCHPAAPARTYLSSIHSSRTKAGRVYGSQLIGLARRRSRSIDSVVIKIRQSRGFAAMVIVTMAVAWFFASNHCALAVVESLRKPDTEHACCHTEQGSSQALPTQCCKALAAPVPKAIVSPALHLHELQPAWIEALRVGAGAETSIAVSLDTGSPRESISFAVLVLNRSLLAHAPPQLVA